MKSKNKLSILRTSAAIISGYLALAVLFYLLAGYQLHYRNSRGNIEMPAAASVTAELVEGSVVEQHFTMRIQRLQSVSVQWGTFHLANTGTATVSLLREDSGEQIMSQTFDVADIADGGTTTLASEAPIEGLAGVPLILQIYTDSEAGSAAAPMITAEDTEVEKLYINSEETTGALCFSVVGEDYIWTGLHYWEFVALFGVLLIAYIAVTYRRARAGKPTLFLKAADALKRYRFLMKQLVDRDFKAKYKRSVLGVFWSFLNPLLNMLVQYIVFSKIFRFEIKYFPVYLLCGNVMFTYFSESCGLSLTSIIGNASLITKVYVPKYIYPLTRIISSLINLAISLIPLMLVALVSGLMPTKALMLIPFPLLCLAVFCLGLGMLLAAGMVFFRDIQFLWGVLITIWMYLTPIFYPVSILEEHLAWVIKINPLYYYISFMRTCIIDGVSPEPVMYVQCALFAVGALIVGAFVFKKSQDKFFLYL